MERIALGPMVTSLKQSGFGFTVWRLPGAEEKGVLSIDEALECWDRKVEVIAWRQ